tara:strand:+ start:442 stop:774 length:333 start_codon:yes stop_codon:yes gene_type:complete
LKKDSLERSPRTYKARETELAIASIGSPSKYNTRFPRKSPASRFSRSEYKSNALALRSPVRSSFEAAEPVETYDHTLTVANRNLSRKPNEPISNMRRTTKRPLPCPHCYR